MSWAGPLVKMKTRTATNLRAIWARSYVRIVGANRELSWLFFEIFLPLLNVSAYVFVYRALHAPPEYEGYVIIGGAMLAYWLNVLWSMASQFYWEKEMGNLELYLMAPISRVAILLGMAVGGMFMSSIRALSILVLGIFLFGVNFQISGVGELVATFVITLVALYGLGMLFSSLFMLLGREGWHLAMVLQEPIYLVSGFYFPITFLGPAVAFSASLIPLTLGMDAMRQLCFPAAVASGVLNVHAEMGILAFLAIAFPWLSVRSLERMERRGRETGRLTLKWQ
jgi:ABC-2 type transport system permease protein